MARKESTENDLNMSENGKPVRKCSGCILNLGESCAVYVSPHERWYHSNCLHYNDEELYNRYLENVKERP